MYQHNDHTKYYAVSHISEHSEEIEIEFIYADNEAQAMLMVLKAFGYIVDSTLDATAEQVKDYAYESGVFVEAVEVP